MLPGRMRLGGVLDRYVRTETPLPPEYNDRREELGLTVHDRCRLAMENICASLHRENVRRVGRSGAR